MIFLFPMQQSNQWKREVVSLPQQDTNYASPLEQKEDFWEEEAVDIDIALFSDP